MRPRSITMTKRGDLADLPETVRNAIPDINSLPPGFREVTLDEVVARTNWGTFAPVVLDICQPTTTKAPEIADLDILPLTTVHLMVFHDGTGVGFIDDYWAAYERHHGQNKARPADTAPAVRWFRFEGCAHSYEAVSSPPPGRSGLHTRRCTRCGYTESYDTSD